MFLLRNAVRAPARSSLRFSTTQASSAVTLKLAFRTRLEEAREQAHLGGGQVRIDSQHKKGKLTARERIELLLDEGSFREYDQLKTHRCTEFGMGEQQYYGDGVVTGHGSIGGRKVCMSMRDCLVLMSDCLTSDTGNYYGLTVAVTV